MFPFFAPLIVDSLPASSLSTVLEPESQVHLAAAAQFDALRRNTLLCPTLLEARRSTDRQKRRGATVTGRISSPSTHYCKGIQRTQKRLGTCLTWPISPACWAVWSSQRSDSNWTEVKLHGCRRNGQEAVLPRKTTRAWQRVCDKHEETLTLCACTKRVALVHQLSSGRPVRDDVRAAKTDSQHSRIRRKGRAASAASSSSSLPSSFILGSSVQPTFLVHCVLTRRQQPHSGILMWLHHHHGRFKIQVATQVQVRVSQQPNPTRAGSIFGKFGLIFVLLLGALTTESRPSPSNPSILSKPKF